MIAKSESLARAEQNVDELVARGLSYPQRRAAVAVMLNLAVDGKAGTAATLERAIVALGLNATVATRAPVLAAIEQALGKSRMSAFMGVFGEALKRYPRKLTRTQGRTPGRTPIPGRTPTRSTRAEETEDRTDVHMTGNPEITFAAETGSIHRHDAGSFINDGFRKGDRIDVIGAKVPENNLVNALLNDVAPGALVVAGTLVDEEKTKGVAITLALDEPEPELEPEASRKGQQRLDATAAEIAEGELYLAQARARVRARRTRQSGNEKG